MGKTGTDGGFLTHGVSIASLARDVLTHPHATARLESTVDAQALTEVSRVHADLNRIDGLLVKASFVDRQLSKPRLCQRFGDFQPAPLRQFEAN
jgi:hypothetical protein